MGDRAKTTSPILQQLEMKGVDQVGIGDQKFGLVMNSCETAVGLDRGAKGASGRHKPEAHVSGPSPTGAPKTVGPLEAEAPPNLNTLVPVATASGPWNQAGQPVRSTSF